MVLDLVQGLVSLSLWCSGGYERVAIDGGFVLPGGAINIYEGCISESEASGFGELHILSGGRLIGDYFQVLRVSSPTTPTRPLNSPST